MDSSNGITDVGGIKVGHYTDTEAATGCTVVIYEDGAVGGVDVRGSSPGTRETDLLRPTFAAQEVHAVVLSGGSTFGLDSASGVMLYLEEKGAGVEFGGMRIPLVPAAILFDLGLIRGDVRPGSEEGYMACQNASPSLVEEGSVGAGTGATVAKLLGADGSIKGGVGTASIDLGDGLVVGAIVAANGIGGIYDADTGDMIAGPRSDDGITMLDSMELITSPSYARITEPSQTSTTIGVVATNAALNKEQTNKLASVAHDGLAIAVRPAHLMNDGDTMFALATGTYEDSFNMNQLCAATVMCVARAIVRAVQKTSGLGGIPALNELNSDGSIR